MGKVGPFVEKLEPYITIRGKVRTLFYHWWEIQVPVLPFMGNGGPCISIYGNVGLCIIVYGNAVSSLNVKRQDSTLSTFGKVYAYFTIIRKLELCIIKNWMWRIPYCHQR